MIRTSMLRGGDSGPALMPGEPDKSLLLAAIRYDGLEMPPDGPLDEQMVRRLRDLDQTGCGRST